MEQQEPEESKNMKKSTRVQKHVRIRKHLAGTVERPRLAVFRSIQHIYAQVIDDTTGKTLVALSDASETGTKKEKAFKLGKDLAAACKKSKITAVVFDRGGFLYQGRVEELAKGAREGGLEF